MFAAERIRIIKNHLKKEQKVSTAKLSELLDVSEVTIRRDLEKLESEGFLERIHGGAIMTDYEEETFAPQDDIDILYADQRREIAETAFYLVEDGDTLMLTEGLTNLQIAKKLRTKNNLTILTNDLRIASEFTDSATNKLIVLGGDLDGWGTYGQMVLDAISNFHFNHLFAEVDGISPQTGLTVSTINKASLIRKAMVLSEDVAVICLSKNFGQNALYRVVDIHSVRKIITDSMLEDRYKQFVYTENIPLYTSINLYEA